MTVDVLIVCAANVCRSPLAGALLARAVVDAGHGSAVRIRSAGVAVAAPAPACPTVRGHVHPGHEVEQELRGHLARQLRPSDIERADLVLAADRAVRSAVVRGAPRAQARIFTLRQAAQLAASVVVPAAAPEVEDAMRRFIGDLDMARGLAGPFDRPRGWRRHSAHPHDVPDAHTAGATHAAVARLLVETVDDLATALLRVLPEPSAPAQSP